MFELPSSTEVRVTSVTNRVEKHGDDEKPAVSLSLELTDANTTLDIIDPTIREALYKAVDDQEQLPGVEPSTPVLRCNAFERHTLTRSYEGWTLTVEDGIDELSPMVFGGVKADKFSVEAKQGGSIVLRFRVGTSDVDAEKLGKLAMHNGQAIYITLIAPKVSDAPIDGSVGAFEADHPEAGDLFAQEHGDAGPEDETDSEGGETDVLRDEDWPFPDSTAAPAPSALNASASKRTARGRAATRAALDAGAPT